MNADTAYTVNLIQKGLPLLPTNVTGVVLDGVGYGTATIKKLAGSIPVTIK